MYMCIHVDICIMEKDNPHTRFIDKLGRFIKTHTYPTRGIRADVRDLNT